MTNILTVRYISHRRYIMIDKKTSITLRGTTKDRLTDLGSKSDSYDDIVMRLFHQRNILSIHSYCGDEKFDEEDFGAWVYNCFKDCNIPFPRMILDGGLNGTGELIPFTDEHLIHCESMATDEDLIGHNRLDELTMAEAVTNAYCLMNDIPAPTWSNSAMRNPLAP